MNIPEGGEPITIQDGRLNIPDHPILPFIEGDGIGVDIWPVARRVFDTAVEKVYGQKRKIHWMEVFAGEKAYTRLGTWLPEETIQAFETFRVGMKGPLTTPVGGGIRSLNVALRKDLDLYACVRPVRWFSGIPSPVKHPERVDMVIFRENTEDIYTGIEFETDTHETRTFKKLLQEYFPDQYGKIRFPDTSGFSLKPVSQQGTHRLVRAAIRYALANHRKSVTLMHKGNIMKFTEGAFRKWGYELAAREFGEQVYTWPLWEEARAQKGEEAANDELRMAMASGKLLIKDSIADIVFEQTITMPESFDVIATLNLNGDYLSDALAAQVGGVGIAPGGNINYETGVAIFEATHGTAPKFAGKNMVNPSSEILSGEMMLRYLGWDEAADLIVRGIERAVANKTVTFDFERLMEGATLVSTQGFGEEIIKSF